MKQSYQFQYADITRRLMENPKKIGDSRIGKINSNFVETLRIDLTKEFPIMDIKWIKFSNVVHELIWMLRGETNPKYLIENDCHIWTDDAYRYYKERFSPHSSNKFKYPNQHELFDIEISKEDFVKKILNKEKGYTHGFYSFRYGNLDKIYGYQWRNFNGKTDQVQNVLNKLKENPDDRRMIIIGHNPTDLEEGNVGLPACHNYMQFYTRVGEDGRRKLSVHCHIRSNDWFLGQPYNVIQYALIAHIFAKLSDMDVDELVITATDAHLYHIHFEPAKEWLRRYDELEESIDTYSVETEPNTFAKDTYCKAKFNLMTDATNVDDLKPDDFLLMDYKPQPYIKAKLLS
jgi:thymidylate synthase